MIRVPAVSGKDTNTTERDGSSERLGSRSFPAICVISFIVKADFYVKHFNCYLHLINQREDI